MIIKDKYELMKLYTSINCFLSVNSVGPKTLIEWNNLKEKIKKELAAKHSFQCK